MYLKWIKVFFEKIKKPIETSTMTKVQTIIKDIEALNSEELEQVLHFLLQKVQRSEKVKNKLRKYRGKGQGVWKEDAQGYINQLRKDDRF